MGVFKEEAEAFETIAQKQTQIYRDAADYGYPYMKDNPPEDVKRFFDVINHLKELDKAFPEDKPLVRNRQTWKGGVSVDVIIFWEQDEGYYMGTKYMVTFQYIGNDPSRIDKEADAFVSVDVERYREKA
jgi:hypothetical protein